MIWRLCIILLTYQAWLPATPKADLDLLITDNRTFALSLYEKLDEQENFIFSPYSIFSSLSMIYVGARGETATQLQKALSLGFTSHKTASLSDLLSESISPKLNAEKGFSLKMANGLWVNKGSFVLSDYRHTLQDDFNAQVAELNFQKTEEAREIINAWTSNTTEGKISQILQEGDIHKATRFVLTNTLYFQGSWQLPFDPKKTKNAPFYLSNNSRIETSMMEQTAVFPYYENSLFQMLALPFEGVTEKGGRLACLLLLPYSGISFQELHKMLSPQSLAAWIMDLENSYIEATIPRFDFAKRYQLDPTLKQLGVELAFTTEADFSGIDGMRDLFLDKVVHEAYISFNEAGVTATAATAGMIGLTSIEEKKPTPFVANRPFLFMLVDLDSKLPLFIGKLNHPK